MDMTSFHEEQRKRANKEYREEGVTLEQKLVKLEVNHQARLEAIDWIATVTDSMRGEVSPTS